MRPTMLGIPGLTVAALVLAACASQPASTAGDLRAADAQRRLADAPDPFCLRGTGSRLLVAEGRCLPGPGRVYTRDELLSTGSTNLGDALRKLHPR